MLPLQPIQISLKQWERYISKFNARSNKAHFTAVKKCSDADWAGDQDDRHSTTRNLFVMSRGPVSWLSKKQPLVSLYINLRGSYVALSIATQEAVWLRRMFGNPQARTHCGNGRQSRSYCYGQKSSKNIYVREAVQDGLISLSYCPREEKIADLLTNHFLTI